MDESSLRGEPTESTWKEVPRWVRLAKLGERAGFATAALMYVLPFFYLNRGEGVSAFSSPLSYGIELFFTSIAYALGAPWPSGVPDFAAFGLPLLMAAAGLVFQKAPLRMGALTRFVCAVVGLGGLLSAYLEFHVQWQFGFYGALAGFAVATVAAGLRSLAAFRYPSDEAV